MLPGIVHNQESAKANQIEGPILLIELALMFCVFDDDYNRQKPVWDLDILPPLEKNFYQEDAITRDRCVSSSLMTTLVI